MWRSKSPIYPGRDTKLITLLDSVQGVLGMRLESRSIGPPRVISWVLFCIFHVLTSVSLEELNTPESIAFPFALGYYQTVAKNWLHLPLKVHAPCTHVKDLSTAAP